VHDYVALCALYAYWWLRLKAASLQVMYDASGVRLHAGRQASVLNMIITELPPDHPVSDTRPLRDSLGHTPLQASLSVCAVHHISTHPTDFLLNAAITLIVLSWQPVCSSNFVTLMAQLAVLCLIFADHVLMSGVGGTQGSWRASQYDSVLRSCQQVALMWYGGAGGCGSDAWDGGGLHSGRVLALSLQLRLRQLMCQRFRRGGWPRLLPCRACLGPQLSAIFGATSAAVSCWVESGHGCQQEVLKG
jgi:hypothetical protein